MAVVKKTFCYANGFFYKRLYRNSLFPNFIMENDINGFLRNRHASDRTQLSEKEDL